MNILILNLHSAKNKGDEAINLSTIDLLNIKYPQNKICFVANDPDSWKNFENIEVLPSFSHYVYQCKKKIIIFFRLIKLIIFFLLFFAKKLLKFPNYRVGNSKLNILLDKFYQADIVYSCGGGNFYTNTILGLPFLLHAMEIIIANSFNKRIKFLPQSFGPFRSNFHKKILKSILNFSEIIFVRDVFSKDLLTDLKITENKIVNMLDLAFFLELNLQKKDKFNEKSIGITIIDREKQFKAFSNQSNYYQSLIQLIKFLVDSINPSIYIIVQSNGPSLDQDDYIISSILFNDVCSFSSKIKLVNNFESVTQLIKFIGQLDFTIASRMHTAIFSLINNIPSLLVGYQPKALGLYKMVGLETCFLDINEITVDNSLDKIKLFLNNENSNKRIPREYLNIEKFRSDLLKYL